MHLVQYRRLFLLVVLLMTASASAQTWNWAAQVAAYTSGGFGANKATGITVDATDNIYVVGDYGDSASFGGIKLKALSGADMYVAKVNASGSYVWVKSFGSTFFLDQAIDVTNDPNGDVYVCGSFSGTLDFGTLQLPSAGLSTVAVAKYNSSGEVQWAKLVPNATAAPGGIAYGFDHIYAAVNRTLAKYELDGDTVWSRTMPVNAAYAIEYQDVTVDIWGCIYVTGKLSGTITYGTYTLSSSSVNDPDMFIVKYDPTGAVMWAKRAGAVSTPGQADIGHGITTSPHGDVYVAGEYKGKAGFDADTIVSGNAITAMFIAKYTSEGALEWVKGGSGTNGGTLSAAWAVRPAANDDIIVLASFGSTMTLVDTTFNVIGADVLVLRLSSAGVRRWGVRSNGVSASCQPRCLFINPAQTAVYAGGLFSAATTFGPTTLTPLFGVTDGFISKMTISAATAVHEYTDLPLPSEFALAQNYPNPFNPTTTIEFRIPQSSRVSLTLYNVLGQHVKKLVDQELAAGTYSTVWDGSGDDGQQLASGVYFYRLQTGAFVESRKMMLMK
jgi:hypothetical protein